MSWSNALFVLLLVDVVAWLGLSRRDWSNLSAATAMFKGRGWRERRRLVRLARSGERVVAPDDAAFLRGYTETLLRSVDSWQSRAANWVFEPLAAVLLFGSPAVELALHRGYVRALVESAVLALFMWGWASMLQGRRRLHRTAVANGWDDRGDQRDEALRVDE